LVSDL